jgi:restriction endonuclease-like protein
VAAPIRASLAYAAALRQELSERNLAYARDHGLAHSVSFGGVPAVVYTPDEQIHGNFLAASYRAIVQQPQWKRRIGKAHAQKVNLPRADRRWAELDSCNSSDALLMNIFCFPRLFADGHVADLVGVARDARPAFGVPARVPLAGGKFDRTEVDMKLGALLVEAKLTESDFQVCAKAAMESYRDFREVFSVRDLPQDRTNYYGYQLIRNVLAAHASAASFCVLLDQRRPDLLEGWYQVMRCVRPLELRTRCKVLTWQELARAVPPALQRFLGAKYGLEG